MQRLSGPAPLAPDTFYHGSQLGVGRSGLSHNYLSFKRSGTFLMLTIKSIHTMLFIHQFTKSSRRLHWQLFLPLAMTATLSLGQAQPSRSNRAVLDVGVRLQKSINLYAENGITAQYSPAALALQRLYVGASYVTSRLGTAFQSNAIKQDNYQVFAAYYFRPRWLIRPMIKANVGYSMADYGSDIFKGLPHTSLTASPEVGLCFCPRFPLKVSGSIGYNLITGNGLTGPGTLYPVFVQTSVTWNVLTSVKN